MLEFILERGNYWAIIGLMMIGLYISFAATNLIKRLIGLGLFQTSIILFYISRCRGLMAAPPRSCSARIMASPRIMAMRVSMAAKLRHMGPTRRMVHMTAAILCQRRPRECLFEPAATRADADGDCGRRRNAGCWSGDHCAYPRGLWHRRDGRNSGNGSGGGDFRSC